MVNMSYNDHNAYLTVTPMSSVVKIESTRAKAHFASLPTQAQNGDLAITRHGRVQAYMLSPARYAQLAAVDRVGEDVMHKLDGDFDALVARMQGAAQARIVKRTAAAPLDTILAAAPPSAPARKPRRRKQAAG